MAVTNGTMTSLPTSQTIFLQTVEETENNRISFRDSLKFFQEQLVINGASFPSPSSTCRTGTDTLRKNGPRFCKEQNVDNNGKTTKDSDMFGSEMQTVRSCKISIPTVDTILESVRVLRAIQKSQEERGSTWHLDVTTTSDIESEFQLTEDWIQVSDLKYEEYSKDESNCISSDVSDTSAVNVQTPDHQEESSSILNESCKPEALNNVNEACISKVSDSINESCISEVLTNVNESCESEVLNNINGNCKFEVSNNINDSFKSGVSNNLNESCKYEVSSNISESCKSEVSNIIYESCISEVSDNINENYSSDDLNNVNDSFTPKALNKINENCTAEVFNDVNDSCISHNLSSNIINEICSFWPSHTLTNGNFLDKEATTHDSSFSVELKEDKAEFHVHNKKGENVKREESDIYNTKESECSHNIVENSGLLNGEPTESDGGYTELQNMQILKTEQTNVTATNEKVCDTPDSLSVACRDLLGYNKVESLNAKNNSSEILNHESNPAIGILKIETYEDLDAQKQDVFLFSEAIWKDSCSPSSNNSVKIENNDSDSGIGTQRSASSLSPNNPCNTQKDSWSDTCSSHYASAECSPYHSLTSVFDASMGLSTPVFAKDGGDTVESSIQPLSSVLENTLQETLQENETPVFEDQAHITSSPEQRDFEPATDFRAVEESVTDFHGAEESLTDFHGVEESLTDFHGVEESLTDFHGAEESLTGTHACSISSLENEGIEQDTEGSYCFVSNYTLESPNVKTTAEPLNGASPVSEDCDTSHQMPKIVNGHTSENDGKRISDVSETESTHAISPTEDTIVEDEPCDVGRIQKFTAASCDLISIVNTLYTIKESPAFQVLPAEDEKFEETLFILSEGAFCEYPEDNYLVKIDESTLHISKDSQILLSLNMKYGEVSFLSKDVLKVDNQLGRYLLIKCESDVLTDMKTKIEQHCLKHWQSDCLQLVHYPLKCHQNVVIVDLGSCSTRAGILMDQPTLPSIFFPTICATDKSTGKNVYGMEALQPEVRQHSNLSFPVRPSIKITKHTIDIDLLEGLFQKIFAELYIDPTQYTVQVCLPRNLSINAQNALVKLLLESLKVKAVSLTNQAILTLYAHNVSTAVVVDIGDRTEVLPVVDGFIVETGVTKLPYGGQRLIHHMKHGLAEKRISLSNDIDSFVVQYIVENLAYVAEDYDAEIQIASKHLDVVKKTITLQPSSPESITCKSITLDDARFKTAEGLFNPELWGLDSPGIHHLVQKAIQATSVDARKLIAENIYVSGGVTMLPGFVERLSKEVKKLSKAKIIPRVYASNYRYHGTYIGACKFAKMEVFPQVCINLDEYSKGGASALKKCALYF